MISTFTGRVQEVTDLNTSLLDNGLRMTNQLLGAWRGALERVIPSLPNMIGPDPTRSDAEKPDMLKVGWFTFCHDIKKK